LILPIFIFFQLLYLIFNDVIFLHTCTRTHARTHTHAHTHTQYFINYYLTYCLYSIFVTLLTSSILVYFATEIQMCSFLGGGGYFNYSVHILMVLVQVYLKFGSLQSVHVFVLVGSFINMYAVLSTCWVGWKVEII
jgi:hypothetical protein